jgi:succinoglycan biosynthesis protein ExoA
VTNARAAGEYPSLSVVIPVRNEAQHLEGAVDAVLAQDYPQPFEVVLAIGPSDDGTDIVAKSLAARDERVKLVDNPKGIIPAALNVAIAASTGDVIARVDGHCELGPGYLRAAVEVLQETGAVNVGGVQEAAGTTPMQRAIAAAMSSRFGVGNARFHYGGAAGPADTVYLGVFRRDAVRAVGGFDEDLLRNEDYELNWRLREAGGTVWFDPRLRVRYWPRPTIGALARQYFAYGQWKREMLRRHPRSLRWRQAVPPVALVANGLGLVAGLGGRRRALVVPLTYAGATLAAARRAGARNGPDVSRRLPLVFATMHHAWAAGLLLGPRPPVRSRRAPSATPASSATARPSAASARTTSSSR